MKCVRACIALSRVSDLVNSIAGRVDGAQLLQVVSSLAQGPQGVEHPLHGGVGPLGAQLLRTRTT